MVKQCEGTYCHRTVHFRTGKMVNSYVHFIPNLLKKGGGASEDSEGFLTNKPNYQTAVLQPKSKSYRIKYLELL